MLLGNRRIALIHLCLAAMQSAGLVAALAFVSVPLRALGLWLLWLWLLVQLLAWMLLLERLDGIRATSPRREGIVVTAILLGGGLAYSAGSMLAGRGAAGLLQPPYTLSAGLQPGAALALAGLVQWQQAAGATGRQLGFFSVGVSFRAGLLWMILVSTAVNAATGLDTLPILWSFTGLGLVATGLARIEEKAGAARSAGRPLTVQRLGQLAAAAILTMAIAVGFSRVLSLPALGTAWSWLGPSRAALGQAAAALFEYSLRLAMPLLVGLERWLRSLDLAFLGEALRSLRQVLELQAAAAREPRLLLHLPAWTTVLLRLLAISFVGLAVLGFILLFLERLRSQGRPAEHEESSLEATTLGGGLLGRGWRRLYQLGRMARRYGFGRQLLAAISVRNIYANLCRLARSRGYPRLPSQPPDAYLLRLAEAFPGHYDGLARITSVYMRVHYGEQPADRHELAAARADYLEIRKAGRRQ